VLASLAFLQSSQRSFELRSAALDVYLFASHVVARSVELNGNVFVLVSWWKSPMSMFSMVEVSQVTLLLSNGETSILWSMLSSARGVGDLPCAVVTLLRCLPPAASIRSEKGFGRLLKVEIRSLDLSCDIKQRELLQALVVELQPTVTHHLPQFLDQASPLLQVSARRSHPRAS